LPASVSRFCNWDEPRALSDEPRARFGIPRRLNTSRGGVMATRKKAAKKKAAKKTARKVIRRKSPAKRELIDTGTNKLYVRRNARGTSFEEVVDVGRSLSQDRRRKAKRVAKPGQGDRGDRRR
jgi:hypothetical protein